MKFFIISLFFFRLTFFGNTQVTTTSPLFPLAGSPVVITFHADRGDQGLIGFTGDVYAHTGVITDKSTSGSDWEYVKAPWNTNIPVCKLTRIGNNLFELTISPDIRSFYGVLPEDEILHLAIVFRSSDGLKTGRDINGNDIFIKLYKDELNIAFKSPAIPFTLADSGQIINIEVQAFKSDSIVLFNGQERLAVSETAALLYDFIPVGTQRIILVANAYSNSDVVADSVTMMRKGTTPFVPLPHGARAGIQYPDSVSALFVLFAPHKEFIYLIGDFNNWQPDNHYLMARHGDFYWYLLEGLEPAKEYIFQYFIDGILRVADPYVNKLSDPWHDNYIPDRVYPNLISYPEGKTTEIAGVIQPGRQSYQWQVNDFTPPAPSDLVIYELLIRDFTAKGDIKTVTDSLPYLKRLGINAIELMPFNEFEGNDSWGYNPSFYFATDKAYGTRNDFKRFVDECHRQGMAVIMDLVLNHSYGQSPFVRMYFEGGKPSFNNPWLNREHNMQNTVAQWGFDFNHESVHTKQLIDSINAFWMQEFRIDGFRFDFTKGFSNKIYGPSSWASEYDASRISLLKRMSNEIWTRNPKAIVIFEHLPDNVEERELADHGILLWGNMNHNFTEGAMGYNTGGKSDFSWMSYKKRGWQQPHLIAYMESHDEERIMYKNLQYGNNSGGYSIKELPVALKRMELASLFYFSVPGPKMIWQFGELGYDVSINDGGRLGRKPIRWDYYTDPHRRSLHDFKAELITLRKKEPVFSATDYTLDVSGAFKTVSLQSPDKMVIVAGNFDVMPATISLSFPSTGWWYDYYGGDSLFVSSTSKNFTFQPGGYILLSNKHLEGFSGKLNGKPSNGKSKVRLYPNPFFDTLFFESTYDIRQFYLTDMTGKIIAIGPLAQQNTITIPSLEKGIYFLILEDENGLRHRFKVLKGS